MAFRRYNTTTQNIRISGNVPREHNCNGYTVTNVGDTAAKVNGKILFPSATPAIEQGDSMSFGGNEGEVYAGYITISFALAPATDQNIEVVQKYYIDDEPINKSE